MNLTGGITGFREDTRYANVSGPTYDFVQDIGTRWPNGEVACDKPQAVRHVHLERTSNCTQRWMTIPVFGWGRARPVVTDITTCQIFVTLTILKEVALVQAHWLKRS